MATKENGLEVNADKTKYMVMSRDQITGRIHNIKIDNSSFASVEEFKYRMFNLKVDRKLSREYFTSDAIYNGSAGMTL